MQGLTIVAGILLAIGSAQGFGFGGSSCGCGGQQSCPPPPPPCQAPPSCGGAQAAPAAPACPAPPPCPTAVCPPQPIYEQCPVCAPIPIYEIAPCPPCPAPPQTICVAQQIPAPQPQPQATQSCCARNPCSSPCSRQRRILGAVIHDVAGTEQDPTCNSKKLKNILEKSISIDTDASKHAIHDATLTLTGKYDVICAYGDFSYIVNSNSFCQLTKDDITCYVFKQA
uniref:Ground-like domain-containing protein n=1 Tax=Plectus sambesii TaxID=2011161 RepID=A0A914UPK2_9BILA